jgi:regulator of replication initiation timing
LEEARMQKVDLKDLFEEVKMLEAEVREVYGDLRRALEEALEATLRHRRAKEALEAAIAQGILAGEVAGKNAEEREAKARSLYPTLFRALLEAEEALTRAKFRLEMAKARAREVEVLAGLAAGRSEAAVLE